jgi:hypothetical protein
LGSDAEWRLIVCIDNGIIVIFQYPYRDPPTPWNQPSDADDLHLRPESQLPGQRPSSISTLEQTPAKELIHRTCWREKYRPTFLSQPEPIVQFFITTVNLKFNETMKFAPPRMDRALDCFAQSQQPQC